MSCQRNFPGVVWSCPSCLPGCMEPHYSPHPRPEILMMGGNCGVVGSIPNMSRSSRSIATVAGVLPIRYPGLPSRFFRHPVSAPLLHSERGSSGSPSIQLSGGISRVGTGTGAPYDFSIVGNNSRQQPPQSRWRNPTLASWLPARNFVPRSIFCRISFPELGYGCPQLYHPGLRILFHLPCSSSSLLFWFDIIVPLHALGLLRRAMSDDSAFQSVLPPG